MGNRALIIMQRPTEECPAVPAIYVHWNGGIESVKAVCDICQERGYRSPYFDPSYALARMTGVWHEFFGINEATSLGLQMYDGKCDVGDNGVYLIGVDWNIIDHYYHGWNSGEIEQLEIEVPKDQQEKYEEIKKYLQEQYKKFLAANNS